MLFAGLFLKDGNYEIERYAFFRCHKSYMKRSAVSSEFHRTVFTLGYFVILISKSSREDHKKWSKKNKCKLRIGGKFLVNHLEEIGYEV